MNRSLKIGIVPSEWKHAKVTPLYKEGNRDDTNNYRPISVLLVVMKIFEAAVKKPICGISLLQITFSLNLPIFFISTQNVMLPIFQFNLVAVTCRSVLVTPHPVLRVLRDDFSCSFFKGLLAILLKNSLCTEKELFKDLLSPFLATSCNG